METKIISKKDERIKLLNLSHRKSKYDEIIDKAMSLKKGETLELTRFEPTLFYKYVFGVRGRIKIRKLPLHLTQRGKIIYIFKTLEE